METATNIDPAIHDTGPPPSKLVDMDKGLYLLPS